MILSLRTSARLAGMTSSSAAMPARAAQPARSTSITAAITIITGVCNVREVLVTEGEAQCLRIAVWMECGGVEVWRCCPAGEVDEHYAAIRIIPGV